MREEITDMVRCRSSFSTCFSVFVFVFVFCLFGFFCSVKTLMFLKIESGRHGGGAGAGEARRGC